ncbi:MAG: trigger factor, partial [Pseudomonadales bacterium]
DAVHQFGGHDKVDPSMLPAEMFTDQAKRRVSLGLIVNAIVEQIEVKLDDERVKARIESMASSYEDPEEVIQYYHGNEQYLGQIQNLVLEEQVVDEILAQANVSEVAMSYEDAIKPAAREAAPDAPLEDDGNQE